MRIKVDGSGLKLSKWHEHVVRFIFGGLITAITGMIAKKFGPSIGGLFLAFPAIFPATATLIEKHETRKKQEHGLRGIQRGRKAVSVDAAGAAIGSIGLLVFAALVWHFLPGRSAWAVLVAATFVWFVTSALFWQIRKSRI